MRRSILLGSILLISILMMAGCQRAEGDAVVGGDIVYLQRIALPDDAVVIVRIQNVTLADAPLEQTLLGEQIIEEPGQVPIAYRVRYHSDDVVENAIYSVIARIEDGSGNLSFINTELVPVITQDNPTSDVEVLVAPVGSVASTMSMPPADGPTPAPTWPPAIVTAAYATVQAYQAGPTSTPGSAPGDTSELENATAVPSQAPVIVNFFASDVPESPDVRFNLNWDTSNASKVEISGFVMDNPHTGSWPIYAEDNDWVLWAANDVAWVDQFLQVRPDHDIGASLSNLSVFRHQVTLSVKDPQFVDRDNLTVLVNGVPILQNYTLDGRFVSMPLSLYSGPNQIQFQVTSEGTTPLAVFEIQVSDVSSGSASQFSRALRAGESEVITITAP
jgi:putative lipoprotein